MASKPDTTTAEIYYDDKKLHSSVQVAGEFSSWDPLTLTNSESSTRYSIIVKDLIPGHSYMYKFIVDGEWILASDGRPITDDDESNINHFLVAPALEEESTAPVPATAPESVTSVPSAQISSQPEDVDEEEPTVKETAFDAEEEPKAPTPTQSLDKDETSVAESSASSAKVTSGDKSLPVVETKQPEVITKPEAVQQPEPEQAVPDKAATPQEKAKEIEPAAAADASTAHVEALATTASAAPSTNTTTTTAASGEDIRTPDEALQHTPETVTPVEPVEPVKAVDSVKPVEQVEQTKDIPAKESPAAAVDASAVAPSTNNIGNQQPVAATTHETATTDSVSRNSSRSAKSLPSTDSSTGKHADGQSHHTNSNQQEQDTKPSFDTPAPATTSTATTTGAATNTNVSDSSIANEPATGETDGHKRSWLSRFFGFFVRLFK